MRESRVVATVESGTFHMALNRVFDAVLPLPVPTPSQSLPRLIRSQSMNSRGLTNHTIGDLRGTRGHSPWWKKGSAMLLRVLFLTVVLLV